MGSLFYDVFGYHLFKINWETLETGNRAFEFDRRKTNVELERRSHHI